MIKDLLPDKYSPFNIKETGNQGYLYEVSDKVGKMVIEEALKINPSYDPNNLFSDDYINDVDEIINNPNLTGNGKETLVKVRIGHSKFTDQLLKSRKKCVLCGLTNPDFLIASHIKLWNKSNQYEKVDPDNGLLLCPHHDALFIRDISVSMRQGLF